MRGRRAGGRAKLHLPDRLKSFKGVGAQIDFSAAKRWDGWARKATLVIWLQAHIGS